MITFFGIEYMYKKMKIRRMISADFIKFGRVLIGARDYI